MYLLLSVYDVLLNLLKWLFNKFLCGNLPESVVFEHQELGYGWKVVQTRFKW